MKVLKALMLVIAMAGTNLCAAADQYVKDMGGKDYFPIGVNYAWKNWGVDFADQGWTARLRS